MGEFGTDLEGPALHTQNPPMPRRLLQAAPYVPSNSLVLPASGPLMEWAPPPHSLLHQHPTALALNSPSLEMIESLP